MLIGGADFYEEYTRARTRENAKLSQKFCTCQLVIMTSRGACSRLFSTCMCFEAGGSNLVFFEYVSQHHATSFCPFKIFALLEHIIMEIAKMLPSFASEY